VDVEFAVQKLTSMSDDKGRWMVSAFLQVALLESKFMK
jgi:hypothetical protein